MRKTTTSPMMRLPLPVPRALLRMLAGYVPAGQSRAEWIREAIRQRIMRERPSSRKKGERP